ncbi:hypothetical protein E2C01_064090 [Portunus trituberculatus]|uniref:Uncharacterized protein n=1 Tax=Portunus trituberculatus TaxID=210409 RepID=A0A5B7HMC0_PORTR|nr:hypothetical protein [Portunus trituberculatus]
MQDVLWMDSSVKAVGEPSRRSHSVVPSVFSLCQRVARRGPVAAASDQSAPGGLNALNGSSSFFLFIPNPSSSNTQPAPLSLRRSPASEIVFTAILSNLSSHNYE